jgi:hypothetical protein
MLETHHKVVGIEYEEYLSPGMTLSLVKTLAFWRQSWKDSAA